MLRVSHRSTTSKSLSCVSVTLTTPLQLAWCSAGHHADSVRADHPGHDWSEPRRLHRQSPRHGRRCHQPKETRCLFRCRGDCSELKAVTCRAVASQVLASADVHAVPDRELALPRSSRALTLASRAPVPERVSAHSQHVRLQERQRRRLPGRRVSVCFNPSLFSILACL